MGGQVPGPALEHTASFRRRRALSGWISRAQRTSVDRMSRTNARSFGAAASAWMTKRMNSTGSGDLRRRTQHGVSAHILTMTVNYISPAMDCPS